jgi:hypothetical protein
LNPGLPSSTVSSADWESRSGYPREVLRLVVRVARRLVANIPQDPVSFIVLLPFIDLTWILLEVIINLFDLPDYVLESEFRR